MEIIEIEEKNQIYENEEKYNEYHNISLLKVTNINLQETVHKIITNNDLIRIFTNQNIVDDNFSKVACHPVQYDKEEIYINGITAKMVVV